MFNYFDDNSICRNCMKSKTMQPDRFKQNLSYLINYCQFIKLIYGSIDSSPNFAFSQNIIWYWNTRYFVHGWRNAIHMHVMHIWNCETKTKFFRKNFNFVFWSIQETSEPYLKLFDAPKIHYLYINLKAWIKLHHGFCY